MGHAILDTVLGLAITPSMIGWVMADAGDSGCPTVAGDEVGFAGGDAGPDAVDLAMQAATVTARIRTLLAASGERLHGVAVTWSDDAAVGAALTQQPKVALAALLMTLIVNDKEPWQSSPVKVRFNDNMHQIGNQASEFGGSKAADAFEHAVGWIGKLPAHGPTLFAALMAMELGELMQLLSVFIAHSYEVFSGEPNRKVGHGYDMAQLIESTLGLNMADWWMPTSSWWVQGWPGWSPRAN